MVAEAGGARGKSSQDIEEVTSFWGKLIRIKAHVSRKGLIDWQEDSLLDALFNFLPKLREPKLEYLNPTDRIKNVSARAHVAGKTKLFDDGRNQRRPQGFPPFQVRSAFFAPSEQQPGDWIALFEVKLAVAD